MVLLVKFLLNYVSPAAPLTANYGYGDLRRTWFRKLRKIWFRENMVQFTI